LLDDPTQRTGARSVKTSELLAARIVRDIVSRRLTAGTRLPTEAAMLSMYEVSRGSLREALRILEVNGLITVKAGPQGGPFVGSVSPSNFSRTLSLFLEMGMTTFEQVLAARVTVEPMLARLAASHPSSALRRSLEEALGRQDALDRQDSAAYVEVVQDFHGIVAQHCGNGVLALFGESLKEVFTERALVAHQPAARWDEVMAEHRLIATAIVAGDAHAAEDEMRKHMDKFAASFRRRYGFLLREVVGWH